MRAEGVSFAHAVQLLRDGVVPSTPRARRATRSTVAKLPPLLPQGAGERELAEQVVDFYAQTLGESPEALDYLKHRGLGDPALVERFRLGVSSLLTLIGLALIGPLVSALRGLRVLPVVAAAAIIAWLGIGLGFLAFIVPGVILSLRWYVVAQAAAIEHEGWLPALRRSRRLTAGHYRHLIVFVIYVTLITSVPTLLVGFAFGHETTTVTSFLVGVALQVITWSLRALAAALMYFDLCARSVAVHP